jgi:hypothetical protein
VGTIGSRAFSGIDKLTDVTCKAVNVPETTRSAFEGSYIEYVTLHVPEASLEAYRTTAPWSGFKTIVPIDNTLPDDAPKCATPTISYNNGRLTFDCETEGAICQYTITDEDIKSEAANVVDLTVAYSISVYATKEGYKDSEVATATLCWIDVVPGAGDITTQVAEVRATPVLITGNGGMLTLTGVSSGTLINVYDLSGKLVGSAHATEGATHISTTLSSGAVAIVKIGAKSVKVMIK